MKNLENLSIEELLNYQNDINQAIAHKKLNMDFLQEQKHIEEFRLEKEKIDRNKKQFISNTKYTKQIENIGFSVLFYSHYDNPRFCFIDYSRPKVNDKYYSIDFLTESGLTKGRDDVTDEDIQKIQSILEDNW